MSLILDEGLLSKHFSDHGVTEVYVVENWKEQDPIHFYVLMKDTTLTMSLFHKLTSECTNVYKLSVARCQESPILMNKKLVWYYGEWRDTLWQ